MTAEEQSLRDQGVDLLRQGLAEQSIDAFLQALEEEPTDPQTYLYLGLAYFKQGSLEKMIETLETAVDKIPASPQIHYNLGVAYQKSHNATLAKDEFLRALGLDPNYAAARQALESMTASSAADDSLHLGNSDDSSL